MKNFLLGFLLAVALLTAAFALSIRATLAQAADAAAFLNTPMAQMPDKTPVPRGAVLHELARQYVQQLAAAPPAAPAPSK